MKLELTPEQKESRAAFRAFSDREIAPYAGQFDREERVPPQVIQKVAQKRYLGAVVPAQYGGLGMDMLTFGLLNEELGRGCSSVRSLLTVHSMVAYAIGRWGSRQQKEVWLPKLASGEAVAAFALSEPNVGSDARSVETAAEKVDDGFVLNGRKKWITYGQIADLFLVFAQVGGKPSAFLVERDRPGLTTTPIQGLLGTRASLLAELHFDDCRIPKENLVGGTGFGFAAVALSALDLGRYSVAWGSVGIGQACLEASLRYSSERQQFNVFLKDHQLIQRMITNMITSVKAARLMCYHAGYQKESNAPDATTSIMMAKYFASTMATKAASDAVQIHGANGCSSDYPVQRYLRDAKVMEIIEGSTQIQQIIIAGNAYQNFQSKR